jgi:epoxide hydrolase-like predicted phosphatase
MRNNLLKMVPNASILRKKRTLALTIFAIVSAFFFIAATNNSETKLTIMNPQETGIKTIVFDLGGVIFTTSKTTHISTILPTILYNPTLLYWLTQINPKEAYFKFLETIPAQSIESVYNDGKQMPLICSDWMSGIKTPAEIKELVVQQLEKTDHATSVKNLFTAVTNLMFVPENLAASQNIVIPMAKLLKKFKEAGYQICILSNWDAHSFEIVKQAHPKLFDLCDEILISGQEKLSKPDPKFFQKLIERTKLNPSECLFIDDEPYNIQAAAQLGFKTIHHTDTLTTSKELISNGLVTLCQTV